VGGQTDKPSSLCIHFMDIVKGSVQRYKIPPWLLFLS